MPACAARRLCAPMSLTIQERQTRGNLPPLRVERVKRLIQSLHAELLLTQLHGGVNLVNLIFPDGFE